MPVAQPVQQVAQQIPIADASAEAAKKEAIGAHQQADEAARLLRGVQRVAMGKISDLQQLIQQAEKASAAAQAHAKAADLKSADASKAALGVHAAFERQREFLKQ